jgi:AcrR family transcriptional regulator
MPSSSDKLLLAAIDLMAEKGYHNTTTKEIAAAAGLNEVTLFRHFGNKLNLLKAAFERYHYAGVMTKLFEEKLVYELLPDLLLVSRTYHETMLRNKKLIQISFKESDALPELHAFSRTHPEQLKKLLTEYFAAMAKKGKVLSDRPELLAVTFMWMNYGSFVSMLNNASSFPNIRLDDYIEESVRVFARGLTP